MENNPLKNWRTTKKLSQGDLAKLIGVKPMTVSRWERGSHFPTKKHWPKIETETGISASDLVQHVKEVAQ